MKTVTFNNKNYELLLQSFFDAETQSYMQHAISQRNIRYIVTLEGKDSSNVVSIKRLSA